MHMKLAKHSNMDIILVMNLNFYHILQLHNPHKRMGSYFANQYTQLQFFKDQHYRYHRRKLCDSQCQLMHQLRLQCTFSNHQT